MVWTPWGVKTSSQYRQPVFNPSFKDRPTSWRSGNSTYFTDCWLCHTTGFSFWAEEELMKFSSRDSSTAPVSHHSSPGSTSLYTPEAPYTQILFWLIFRIMWFWCFVEFPRPCQFSWHVFFVGCGIILSCFIYHPAPANHASARLNQCSFKHACQIVT